MFLWKRNKERNKQSTQWTLCTFFLFLQKNCQLRVGIKQRSWARPRSSMETRTTVRCRYGHGFFFGKHFLWHLINLHHWNRASGQKWNAWFSFWHVQGKGGPFSFSLKLTTNNYFMINNGLKISSSPGKTLGMCIKQTKALIFIFYLEEQLGHGHRTVPFLWCTFQMIIPSTVTIKS